MRHRAKQVFYNGMLLHSMLELKFVLLIEEKCAFIRSPLSIWYNKDNLDLTVRSECRFRYTPDFLVRKIRNGSAHLIEVKPEKYLDEEEVLLKQEITRRYIARKGHDWKFSFITEKDIDKALSTNQREKLSEIRKMRWKGMGALKMKKLHNKYSKEKEPLHTRIPANNWILDFVDEKEYIYWVKKGRYKVLE